jgi:hypothetical protein
VFLALDSAARNTDSARVAIFQGLAVECLREGNRKLILPDAARSRHQQRLSNAIFTDRALKHFLYAIVSYE